jgi:thiosulfate dehydrogenase
MNANFQGEGEFFRSVQQVITMVVASLILIVATFGLFFFQDSPREPQGESGQVTVESAPVKAEIWQAPDSSLIPQTPEGDQIRYGRDLIAHTAKYLGPKGKVRASSNGMNCQNCHLKAGTKPFGNNYAAVASTYPKYRARSGSIETFEKRINDCIERSLNGESLEEGSVEMRAIVAYFKWLGKDVKKGVVPEGAGITSLPFLKRPADPLKGKRVYTKHCLVCHGEEGVGAKHPDSLEWTYPPLAGMQSYNVGAGLFRLSRFAGYVKSNMPHGTTYDNPVLTDEEAWDVAAYVNSLPRPLKNLSQDWPDVAAKPFDHPFGPYADTFPEVQHKYGPFEAIIASRKKK